MNQTDDCGNPNVLMSYLYAEGDQRERDAFEAHLRTCERCAGELADLRSVRVDLAAWTPPEALLDFRIVRDPAPRRRSAWLAVPDLPAWAQFAAAMLVVGVAVGLSGLEVNYSQAAGLRVRAGWSAPAPGAPVQGAAASGDAAPWTADLVALRKELRSERSQAVQTSTPASSDSGIRGTNNAKPLSDEEFMARIRPLLDARETRLQREMAVRIAQVVRDMDTQRRADMARVADGIGVLEGRTGAAVASQREMMNYLMRVSQKQQ